MYEITVPSQFLLVKSVTLRSYFKTRVFLKTPMFCTWVGQYYDEQTDYREVIPYVSTLLMEVTQLLEASLGEIHQFQ